METRLMHTYFDTSDTYLAGYLMAAGCDLASHKKSGRSIIFSLEQTDKLDELVKDYYNMKANINPLHYGSALKILKNILHQANNNNYELPRNHEQPRKAN